MGIIADIHKDLDRGALQLLVEYRGRLYGEAVRLCGDKAQAEDLVFRTLERVLDRADTYKEDINLFAWMKSIMENIHKDDLKRPVPRGTMAIESGELERCAGSDWSTDEQILKNSDGEVVREALRHIDPEFKQLLLMRYYDEFSLKEIAGILNKPIGTVGRRIQIAHRLLAGKLGTKLGKKPIALVFAAFLGVCTLFGAWQGGVFDLLFKDETPQSRSTVAPTNATPFQVNQQNNEGTSEMKIGSPLKSITAAALTSAALASSGVTVDVTKVQQRYPWNGLVDIDYTITRTDGEPVLEPTKHSVEISVVNCEVTPAVTNVAHVFRQGALPVSDGAHRVTWDANAEGVNFRSQNVKVFAEVVHYAEKYMVIDVHEGPNATVYPVTYLHGAPDGGFNTTTEYKGDKIVLRLIPPGSFVMGSPTTEPGRTSTAAREVQHAVAITKPYYLGVFQITQKQYKNVMNADPSKYKGDCRPVENVSYNMVRGTVDGAKWPQANSVDGTSFMGRLRTKCKEWDSDTQTYAKAIDGLFDLPTDAQWEYACRAGTMTPFNNGVACANEAALDVQLNNLGRYTKSGGSSSKHADVGTAGAPNAWGLYDMHGNVWEWCLDWYQEDVQNITNPSLDPVGAAAGSLRMRRGGSWTDDAWRCRSAGRNGDEPKNENDNYGFRLSRTLP